MKGKRYKIAAFLILLCFIQISALNYIEFFGVKPNILFAGVAILALYRGSRAGIETGIIAGLLYDLGSSAIFGAGIISFTLCGWTIGFLGKNLYKENILLRLLLVFAFSLANGFVYYLISSIFQPALTFVASIKYIILPDSLYTTLVSPLVFLILKKLSLTV